jgi:hypothetical protein
MPNEMNIDKWMPTIARSFAFLCLQSEEGRKIQGVLDKVSFLEMLGLDLEDAAVLAGSTPASVRELRRRKKAKGTKRGTKKAKRS